MLDLIERLEKAEAGSREIDADMAIALNPKFAGWIKHPNLKADSPAWMQGELWPSREEFDDWLIRNGKPCSDYAPAYTTSLDAITALMGEKLRVGPITVTMAGSGICYIDNIDACGPSIQAFGNTPPLACCIALLRALASKEATDG